MRLSTRISHCPLMNNKTEPFLTVIIPAYNREQYLGEAIRSALEQTRPPDEIIVVDDGSTDSTVAVAKSFGGVVRCLSQQNGGVASARNHGVEASSGELLAFLDSDDMWFPQKLEWQLRHLDSHPETDMVFGHMQSYISPELESTYHRSIDTTIIPGVSACTLLIRKDTFLKIGPFDLKERETEFIEWFSRAQDLGCASYVCPELVSRRRVHLSNTVLDRVKMNSLYARVIKTILDRRRAGVCPR
jgi:glycosyltransferase involved in cell wall biosynthesis